MPKVGAKQFAEFGCQLRIAAPYIGSVDDDPLAHVNAIMGAKISMSGTSSISSSFDADAGASMPTVRCWRE
jgi:hypothetical protein